MTSPPDCVSFLPVIRIVITPVRETDVQALQESLAQSNERSPCGKTFARTIAASMVSPSGAVMEIVTFLELALPRISAMVSSEPSRPPARNFVAPERRSFSVALKNVWMSRTSPPVLILIYCALVSLALQQHRQ